MSRASDESPGTRRSLVGEEKDDDDEEEEESEEESRVYRFIARRRI